VLYRVESKNDIRNVLFASIVDKVRFNGNLLVGFQKDVRSKFPDGADIRAGVTHMRRQPRLAFSDTDKNARGKRHIWPGIRNPLNRDSFTVGIPRELKKIVYHITVVNIVRVAHERMREVVSDGV